MLSQLAASVCGVSAETTAGQYPQRKGELKMVELPLIYLSPSLMQLESESFIYS